MKVHVKWLSRRDGRKTAAVMDLGLWQLTASGGKRQNSGAKQTARAYITGCLSALFVVSSNSFVFAQQPNTLIGSVQSLEMHVGVSNAHMSLTDRVAFLENRVFGAPQSGSLLVRIDGLKHALGGPPGQPYQGPPLQPPPHHLPPHQPALQPAQHQPALQPAQQSAAVPSLTVLPAPKTFSTGALKDGLPLLNAGSPNFVRIESPDAPAKADQDYIEEVLKAGKGKVFRYKAMPVPVYVNNFPDRNFVTSVIKGFESWESRTGGSVRFVQVDDPNKARIQVVWKRLGGDEDKSGCLLGAHTITRYTARGKGSMSVMSVGLVPVPVYVPKFGKKYDVPPQIIEVNLDLVMSKNPRIRYLVLQNIVTHELGHALGLLGHSKDPCDMMNPVTDEHSRISERDVNTLYKLYKTKVDIPL